MKERYSEKQLLDIATDAFDRGQNASLFLHLCIVAADNTYLTKLTKDDLIRIKAILENIWLNLDGSPSLQVVVDNVFAYLEDTEMTFEEFDNLGYEKVFDIATAFDEDACYY